MQWRIEGSSAASGTSVTLSVDAPDEASARAAAAELGIVPSTCVAVAAPLVNYATPPPGRSATLTAAVLLAGALVFASLLVTFAMYRFRGAAPAKAVPVATTLKPAFRGFPAAAPAVVVSPQVRQLIDSANRGDVEAVRRLLQDEPDVNAADAGGETALSAATGGPRVESAKLIIGMLIARGAKVDVADTYGRRPLHAAAASRGAAEIVRQLLAAGADPNTPDRYGNAPAHLAAELGNDKPLAELLAHGAKVDLPDAAGQTPLHRAAATGKKECVIELVKAGANVNAKDAKGYTPLKRANLSFREEVAAYLKGAGGTE